MRRSYSIRHNELMNRIVTVERNGRTIRGRIYDTTVTDRGNLHVAVMPSAIHDLVTGTGWVPLDQCTLVQSLYP